MRRLVPVVICLLLLSFGPAMSQPVTSENPSPASSQDRPSLTDTLTVNQGQLQLEEGSPDSETVAVAESAQGDGEETKPSNGLFSQYLLPVLVTAFLGVATYLLFTVRSR